MTYLSNLKTTEIRSNNEILFKDNIQKYLFCLSFCRVTKVRLVPQDLQEHLVPEGLQETQAKMGHRATQESRWDTCFLSHMVSCACVFTELTHSTAVVSHIWVTLCWQPLLRRPGAASHWAEPCAQCWVQTHCISFYTCVLGRCSQIKVTWFKICTNCAGQDLGFIKIFDNKFEQY